MKMKTKLAFIFGICIWQIFVILLVGSGIMVDIYHLIGISWHAQSLINVIGIITGLIVLEIPVFFILGTFYLLLRKRERHAPTNGIGHVKPQKN